MQKLLLTAFEPFGGETLNPSLAVAQDMAGTPMTGVQVDILVLPVERFNAIDVALQRLLIDMPDIVLMLGEAGRRFRITPERVAINVDDFRIPDNGGDQPRGEPIVADGPVGYFSTLPITEITEQLVRANIPAAISNSAGTYLCNRLFYRVMHEIAVAQLPMSAGFMHLPYLHEQAVDKRLDVPSLSRQTLIDAVRIAIEVSCRAAADLPLEPEGEIRV